MQSSDYPQPQRPSQPGINTGQFRSPGQPPQAPYPLPQQQSPDVISQYLPPTPYPLPQPHYPQQAPQKPQLTRGGKIVLVIFGLIIAVIIIVAVVSHRATTTVALPATNAAPARPTTRPTTSQSAYQLAAIDHPGIAQNDPAIAQYQTLLDTLHTNTGDSEQGIAGGTIEGQRLLNQKGHPMTILAILENMKTVTADKTGVHYADALAAWITIVEGQ